LAGEGVAMAAALSQCSIPVPNETVEDPPVVPPTGFTSTGIGQVIAGDASMVDQINEQDDKDAKISDLDLKVHGLLLLLEEKNRYMAAQQLVINNGFHQNPQPAVVDTLSNALSYDKDELEETFDVRLTGEQWNDVKEMFNNSRSVGMLHEQLSEVITEILDEMDVERVGSDNEESEDQDDWEQVYEILDLEVNGMVGKLYVTYGGGPEGGYFLTRRGLYTIERSWGQPWCPQRMFGKTLVVNSNGDHAKVIDGDNEQSEESEGHAEQSEDEKSEGGGGGWTRMLRDSKGTVFGSSWSAYVPAEVEAAIVIQRAFRSAQKHSHAVADFYIGEKMKVIYIGTRTRTKYNFYVGEDDTIGGFKQQIWCKFHGEERLAMSADDFVVIYHMKTAKSNKMLSDILTFKQLGFTIEASNNIPYEFELNFTLDAGGKRACPNITDADKLERLILKQRADTRRVTVAEIDEVIQALQDSKQLILNLRGNPMAIQQRLATLSSAQLQELLDAIPSGGNGKGASTKLLDVGKVVFSTISGVEDGLHHVKALYAYLASEYMAAYAREFHSLSKAEYAELDNRSFKNAVEGAMNMKRQADTQAIADGRIRAAQGEVDERAKRMAEQMLQNYLAEQKQQTGDKDAEMGS